LQSTAKSAERSELLSELMKFPRVAFEDDYYGSLITIWVVRSFSNGIGGALSGLNRKIFPQSSISQHSAGTVYVPQRRRAWRTKYMLVLWACGTAALADPCTGRLPEYQNGTGTLTARL
jgi:hypothetical protein